MEKRESYNTRLVTYVVLFIGLSAVYYLLRDSAWQGTTQLHTLMELLATTLAFFVGVIALIKYYSKKDNASLFIGVAFLGTAFLDGYHAIVTSSFFSSLFPSLPSALIPWSWIASRLFLSVVLVLSVYAWRREVRMGVKKGRIQEWLVYVIATSLTLASFLFFAFYPLPRAYYPELFFGRPEEFIPAFFFLVAIIGYFKKGKWKTDYFEHWLMMSLIVGFVAQAVFMSLSFGVFDFQFDAAHLLKKVSYVLTLVGLLISMFYLFREAESGREKLEENTKDIMKARDESEEARKLAEGSKDAIEKALHESDTNKKALERMNRAMTDRELKMMDLKKEIAAFKYK